MLYHIPQSRQDSFGHLGLDLGELYFMEMVVFGLVKLEREGLDLVEGLDIQVLLAELEKFGNGLVYWILGLWGYGSFGLRHLMELVKDLAIVAMFRE